MLFTDCGISLYFCTHVLYQIFNKLQLLSALFCTGRYFILKYWTVLGFLVAVNVTFCSVSTELTLSVNN